MRATRLYAAISMLACMMAYAPLAQADPITGAIFTSAFLATTTGAIVGAVTTMAITAIGAVAPRAITSGLISGRSAMPAASMDARSMNPIRDSAHPAAIWGRVEGDCIAPAVPDGCWWISDVTRRICPRDYVTFAFKPELEMLPAMTKRFVGARGDRIVIETTNPQQSATAMIDTLQFCYHVEPLPALAAAIPSDWIGLPLEEQVVRIQARLRATLSS